MELGEVTPWDRSSHCCGEEGLGAGQVTTMSTIV